MTDPMTTPSPVALRAEYTPARFVAAEGGDMQAMREHFEKTDVYRAGDAILVWVNEGDLYPDGLFAKRYVRAPSPVDVSRLSRLLLALANDCDNTDGWEDAAPDLRQAASIIASHNTEADAPCSLCNGTTTVPDNIDPLSYPETAPCPKCGDGEWAYRALRKRRAETDALREALRRAANVLEAMRDYFCGDDLEGVIEAAVAEARAAAGA